MWEYHSCNFNLAEERCNRPDDGLNKLGAEGWELVTCWAVGTWTLACIFKRPKVA